MIRRRVADVFVTSERHTTRIDVLFVVAITLLLAVHLTIFLAVLVLAPETASEARNLQLVRLPLERRAYMRNKFGDNGLIYNKLMSKPDQLKSDACIFRYSSRQAEQNARHKARPEHQPYVSI